MLNCGDCECKGAEFCPLLREEAERENKKRNSQETFSHTKTSSHKDNPKRIPRNLLHIIRTSGIKPLKMGRCSIIISSHKKKKCGCIILKSEGKELARKTISYQGICKILKFSHGRYTGLEVFK